jgi:hypothetical protein
MLATFKKNRQEVHGAARREVSFVQGMSIPLLAWLKPEPGKHNIIINWKQEGALKGLFSVVQQVLKGQKESDHGLR